MFVLTAFALLACTGASEDPVAPQADPPAAPTPVPDPDPPVVPETSEFAFALGFEGWAYIDQTCDGIGLVTVWVSYGSMTADVADQVFEVDCAESVVFDAVEVPDGMVQVRTIEPPVLPGEPLGVSDWVPLEPTAVDTLPPLVVVVCDGGDVDDWCGGA